MLLFNNVLTFFLNMYLFIWERKQGKGAVGEGKRDSSRRTLLIRKPKAGWQGVRGGGKSLDPETMIWASELTEPPKHPLWAFLFCVVNEVATYQGNFRI